MNIVNPVELIKSTLAHEGKVLLLSDNRVRVYNKNGVTVCTVDLETQPEHVQDTIIDLIMPYID